MIWGTAGPAPPPRGGAGTAARQCPCRVPPSHRGCPGALWAPPALGSHRAGRPRCRAGLGARAGSLCSAPGLGCAARAGSAPRRRLPGPPGSPGSAGVADGRGGAGMAGPPTAPPSSLSEGAEPRRLPPAVSTASFGRERSGSPGRGAPGLGAAGGRGSTAQGPRGARHSPLARGAAAAAPGEPGGSGSGWGDTDGAAEPSRGGGLPPELLRNQLRRCCGGGSGAPWQAPLRGQARGAGAHPRQRPGAAPGLLAPPGGSGRPPAPCPPAPQPPGRSPAPRHAAAHTGCGFPVGPGPESGHNPAGSVPWCLILPVPSSPLPGTAMPGAAGRTGPTVLSGCSPSALGAGADAVPGQRGHCGVQGQRGHGAGGRRDTVLGTAGTLQGAGDQGDTVLGTAGKWCKGGGTLRGART